MPANFRVSGFACLVFVFVLGCGYSDRKGRDDAATNVRSSFSDLTDSTRDPLPDSAICKLGSSRLRLRAASRRIQFSPDEKHVALWERSKGLQMFDVVSGRELFSIQKLKIEGAGFISNTELVVMASNRVIKISNDGKQEELFQVSPHFKVATATFADDGQYCAIALHKASEYSRFGIADGSVRMFSMKKPFLVSSELRPDVKGITSIALGTNSRNLAIATEREVLLWQGDQQKWVSVIESQRSVRPSVELFDLGNKMLVVSEGTVTVWDTNAATKIRELSKERVHVAAAKAIGTDKILIVGSDNTVRIWHADDHLQVTEFDTIHPIRSLDVSSNGKLIAIASWFYDQGNLRIWDLEGEQELHRQKGQFERIDQATFTPDGSAVVTSGLDRSILVWKVSSGKLQWGFGPHGASTQRRPRATSFLLHAKSNTVLAGNLDEIVTYNLSNGKTVRRFPSHGSEVLALGMIHDQDRFISVTLDKQPTLVASDVEATLCSAQICDLETGQIITKLGRLRFRPDRVAVAPHSSLFAAADRQGNILGPELHFYRVKDGMRIHSIAARAFAFAIDQQAVVVVENDGHLRQYDTNDWTKIKDFGRQPGYISSLQFSSDGNRIAIGTPRGSRVIDSETGDILWQTPKGLPTGRKVAFGPQGRRLVTINHDATGYVWNTIDSSTK